MREGERCDSKWVVGDKGLVSPWVAEQRPHRQFTSLETCGLALLHSVPFGKMIVLDLFADVKPMWKNSSQFYGTPYVWCMLHNFGGNIEMYGILDVISSGPFDACTSENSTMVGVGMCMEGIEHNPVVYELMSEMAFRSEKVQVLVHLIKLNWLLSFHV